MAAIEAALPLRQQRRARLFRERVGFADLRDGEVLARYRLSREAIVLLERTLRGHLSKQTNRSKSIPVLTQVLIGLRYLAKGDLLSEVADLHGVSRSSACNIIEKFVEAVNESIDNIRFPVGRSLDQVKLGFYRRCRIPNTLGAVDGTLIPIIAPAENEDIYVCRKNYHAINVQAVVDHRGMFTDIVSKWPGSTHDASIFENSGIKAHLERNDMGQVLGDSGYALRKYLLTPVLNPANNQEMAYNQAHSRGRMVVERTFGMLKSRFRCLHKTGGVLYRKPGFACKIVVACAKLHNLCMEQNVGLPDVDELVIADQDNEIVHVNVDVNAAQHRQQIINLF